jgi:peptide/nickel transport system substrate-binding protein
MRILRRVATLLLVLTCCGGAARGEEGSVLRFIPQADLRMLDPIYTTAYITRNHGFMIYDTLFGTDAHFQPQPQMVDHGEVSADHLVYIFTLRDKLKFSDGSPVRAADCVASLYRWMEKDGTGQMLARALDRISAVDDHVFRITLKQPFPLLLSALGKTASNVPFIMPERIAKTPANEPITDLTGSGPFIFVKDAFEPGHKAVYVKNPYYVPRAEPPSWTAGGKVVKVDRVEWIYIPDQATALSALITGEVDWWQQVPTDAVPLLEKTPGVTVIELEPLRFMGNMALNHLQPPFDNLKLRQALLRGTDQAAFMAAVGGDARFAAPCYSVYGCGVPMSTEAGTEALMPPREIDTARRLVAESGYKGETAVVLDATDYGAAHIFALVTADLLRRLGVTVDLQAMDWGTVLSRRTKKEPVEKGGWSVFFGSMAGTDALDPVGNFQLRADGDKAWFGWSDDPKMVRLRNDWVFAEDDATRRRLAAELQEEAYRYVSYIPLGQFAIPTAYRNLSGVLPAPVVAMWNVEKR